MESLESIDLAQGAGVRKSSGYIRTRRYVGAFFIYLIYSIMLWGAFKKVVGSTLSMDRAAELVERGIIRSVWDYGWGEHYAWFLILFCVSVYCSAVLAGATAKKRGPVVTGIANLPGVLVLAIFCAGLYLSEVKIEKAMAWKIVLPTAILGSIFLSVFGGATGQKWQNSAFTEDTVLGIRPIHWWWLVVPLYLGIMELVPKVIATLSFLAAGTIANETKYAVLFFMIFVLFATFIYFVIWGWVKALQLLSKRRKPNFGKVRVVLSVLFCLVGIPILFDLFCGLVFVLFK